MSEMLNCIFFSLNWQKIAPSEEQKVVIFKDFISIRSTFAVFRELVKLESICVFNFSLSLECSHSDGNSQAGGTDLHCSSLPALSYINI